MTFVFLHSFSDFRQVKGLAHPWWDSSFVLFDLFNGFDFFHKHTLKVVHFKLNAYAFIVVKRPWTIYFLLNLKRSRFLELRHPNFVENLFLQALRSCESERRVVLEHALKKVYQASASVFEMFLKITFHTWGAQWLVVIKCWVISHKT